MAGKHLFHGAIANALAVVLSVVVNLALTPFLIHKLGVESYGLWTLVLSLSITHGFLSFTDFGVASSIVKLVGEFSSQDEAGRRNEVISGGVVFLAITGAVGGVLLWLSSGLLTDFLFRVPERFQTETRLLISLMGFVVFVDLLKIGFSAVHQGLQQFSRYKVIQISGLILQASLIVLFVSTGGGLVCLGIAALVSSLCQTGLYAFSLGKVLPGWVFPARVSREVWNRLLRTSSLILIIRLQAAVYRSMDRIIIGIFLLPAVLTNYDIAAKIAGLGISVVTIVSSMMVSPAAALVAANRRSELGGYFITSTKYTLLMTLPVLVVIFLYADELITLWIGQSFTEVSVEVIILSAHVLFVALIASGQNMLIGVGRLRTVALVTAVMTTINLMLSLLLVLHLELRGVIVATFISGGVSAGLFLRVISREFCVQTRAFINRLLLPAFLPALASTALYFLIERFAGTSWLLSMPIGLLVLLTTYLLVLFLFSVNREERLLLVSYLPKIRRDFHD